MDDWIKGSSGDQNEGLGRVQIIALTAEEDSLGAKSGESSLLDNEPKSAPKGFEYRRCGS